MGQIQPRPRARRKGVLDVARIRAYDNGMKTLIHVVTLRLDDRLHATLSRLAKRDGRSKSDYLRRLVERAAGRSK